MSTFAHRIMFFKVSTEWENRMEEKNSRCLPESPNHFCSLPNDNAPLFFERKFLNNATIFFFSDISYNSAGFEFSFIKGRDLNATEINLIESRNDTCPGYRDTWDTSHKTDNGSRGKRSIKYKQSNNDSVDESIPFSYFDVYQNSVRDDFADFQQTVFFDQHTIRQYGNQKSDFIVQCSFDNENCGLDNFLEIEDPTYGKCFTFNSQMSVLAQKIPCISKVSKVNCVRNFVMHLSAKSVPAQCFCQKN